MRLKSLVASLVFSTSVQAQGIWKPAMAREPTKEEIVEMERQKKEAEILKKEAEVLQATSIRVEFPYFTSSGEFSFPLIKGNGVSLDSGKVTLSFDYEKRVKEVNNLLPLKFRSDDVYLGPVYLRKDMCKADITPNIIYKPINNCTLANIFFDGDFAMLPEGTNVSRLTLEGVLEMGRKSEINLKPNVSLPYDFGSKIPSRQIRERMTDFYDNKMMDERTIFLGSLDSFPFIFAPLNSNGERDFYAFYFVGDMNFNPPLNVAFCEAVNLFLNDGPRQEAIQIQGKYLGSEKSK